MMSQLSVQAKDSVIRADNPSLGGSSNTLIKTGVYESKPCIHEKQRSNKVRDSWSEITDILSGTGYPNGEDSIGRGRQVRLPSPLYNRNPGPYFPSTPTNANSTSYTNQSNNTQDEDGEVPVRSAMELEQARLEELVAICCEYERQAQLEKNGRLTQNRIKTNGSLTRDKRLPGSPSASPRIHQSFSFDSSELKNACCDGEKNYEVKPPHSYENVVLLPGSPRPRIRTIPSKDGRDFTHESSENRIPLCLDSEHHSIQNLPTPFINNCPQFSETSQKVHITEDSEIVERRCKEDDEDDDDDDMSSERRSSIAEINANNKYNFLGFDPRRSESDRSSDNGNSEPLRAVLHSSPSWASPTIDYDSYPDYDTVDDQIDLKPTKLTLPLDDRPPSNSEIESLKIERTTIMKRLTSLKSKVSDLELQEEEQLRECEMESALVSGEINSQREKIKEEELRVINLKCSIQECDIEMEKCLAEQDHSQRQFRSISERSKAIIQTLENKINSCDSHEFRKELYDSLSQQIELLDAEKKAHEDIEFRLLEEEASWLSRREDIQKEMSEAMRILHLRREKLSRLESPSSKANSQIDIQRISHLKAIEQDRSRLKNINVELERLTKLPPEVDSCSSTTDDEVMRVRSGASIDDLDRISRVTSTTPIDMCNSLGRKTIRSLQEIERNRHLHLAKQGSLVIQEERQRVEELKKRVQDEVKAQWAQQHFNHSLTSLASDQSSLEPARDSGLGSEEPDKRTSPDEDIKPLDSDLIDGKEEGESRPLSDASTCSEDQHVRLRSKSSSNLQRPLTRYLPIRGEGLDLRQHVLEAGHQADLCPGLILDGTSCRGFLLKLGSRWPRWNKRWFVFDRTKRCLAYFSDKSEKKIRGGAYFQAIEEVYVDHQNSVKSPNPKVTFVVKSVNRTFHLVAPSPEAMRIWVDVIFTGAEGYQQYSSH